MHGSDGTLHNKLKIQRGRDKTWHSNCASMITKCMHFRAFLKGEYFKKWIT